MYPELDDTDDEDEADEVIKNIDPVEEAIDEVIKNTDPVEEAIRAAREASFLRVTANAKVANVDITASAQDALIRRESADSQATLSPACSPSAT